MASSLNDIVTAIAPTISADLISPQALQAIGTVAQHFPLTLGTTVGFECPLSITPPAADFFMRVSGAWGQSLLAGDLQPPPVLNQLRLEPELFPPGFACLWADPPWQRIRTLASHWSESTSLLHDAIDDLWLEFDIAADTQGLPTPSSFFGVKSPGVPSLDWVGQIALPILLDHALSAATQQTLQQCLDPIADPARLFQVGVLTGRISPESPDPALRLYIRDVPLTRLRTTLQRLAWPGDVEVLSQVLSRVCQGQDRVSLQLEFQDRLSPVIAVECYFHDRSEWQRVLHRLTITGFCTSERAQALLDYAGYVRAQDQVAPFPEQLARWSTQLAPYRECLLVKRLAYLKFICEPNQPLAAKAYLGVSPTWVDGRYLNDGTAPGETHDRESMAIHICKALIEQLDYSEVDVDALLPNQRSQKVKWLNQALEIMCVGG